MNPAVMNKMHYSSVVPEPRIGLGFSRTDIVVRIAGAVLAVLLGATSMALAGGALIDGRGDGPGWRDARPRSLPTAPMVPTAAKVTQEADAGSARPENRPNTASRRSIIACFAGASTKLASKLLRASA